MKLTIAIPTYNRNDILLQNLRTLLPQLTPECQLLILDNCSDVPVETTLRDLLEQHPHVSKRIIRNRGNIGSAANILRCFELSESEWIWCLGDDDYVVSDAVSSVIQHIAEYPRAHFLNFLTPIYTRRARVRACGMHDFLGAIDHFGTILCISASVFRLKPILPNLRYGYQYISSFAPNLALLLVSLGDKGECVLLERALLSKIIAAGPSRYWSLIDVALGMFALQRLPELGAGRQALAKRIATLVVFEGVVFQLITLRLRGMARSEALYLYDDYSRNCWQATKRIVLLLKIVVYRLCIVYPSVGHRLFEMAIAWKGRKPEDYATPNRE